VLSPPTRSDSQQPRKYRKLQREWNQVCVMKLLLHFAPRSLILMRRLRTTPGTMLTARKSNESGQSIRP
jgi:hypothetical protein